MHAFRSRFGNDATPATSDESILFPEDARREGRRAVAFFALAGAATVVAVVSARVILLSFGM